MFLQGMKLFFHLFLYFNCFDDFYNLPVRISAVAYTFHFSVNIAFLSHLSNFVEYKPSFDCMI